MNFYLPEGALEKTAENREKLSSPYALENAQKNGEILEAPVTLCDSNLALHVDLGGGLCGIIEREEAFYCRPGENQKEIAIISRVGKPVAFQILKIEREGAKITKIKLSRRAAQKEALEHLLHTVETGDIIDAKVTHMEPFGAFLDIGCGISALLPVDRISVSRISHPKERLSVGENIRVAVQEIYPESERFGLSLRELLGTWEENVQAFHVGQTVPGIIRSVESYGIFIELAPNLAGLAEAPSGMEAEEFRGMIGKAVAVYIKSILPERMKIKLVLVDSLPCTPPSKALPIFIDPAVTHLDVWRYSPIGSQKLIETVF